MDHGNSVWFQESDMLYKYVIDTVVQNCKEHFLDEGCSEDVLLDLKAIWEQHVENSKVTYNHPAPAAKLPGSAKNQAKGLIQVDGTDSSDEDLASKTEKEQPGKALGEEGVPPGEEITSDDDESTAEDPEILMDCDNIVVCQYEKVIRSKNKWKLQLKAGIMTLDDKDYVFHKCSGEANW